MMPHDHVRLTHRFLADTTNADPTGWLQSFVVGLLILWAVGMIVVRTVRALRASPSGFCGSCANATCNDRNSPPDGLRTLPFIPIEGLRRAENTPTRQ